MNPLDYAVKVEKWQGSAEWRLEVYDLLDRLHPISGKRVLDIGTNTGAIMKEIARQGGQPGGVEPNVAARNLAAVQSPTLEIHRSIPDAGGNWDAVVLAHVLCHAEQPRQLIQQSLQALKRGGKGVIATLSPAYDKAMWPANILSGYKSDPTIQRILPKEEIIQAIWDYGGEVKGWSRWGKTPSWMPIAPNVFRSRIHIEFFKP